jgi:hypothetical protein
MWFVSLSDRAVQRLAALGVTGEPARRFWRNLWQCEGESFFWGFIQREEEAAAEYCQWFPKLQAFAAECRRVLPAPLVSEFSAAEREQHRILFGKMRKFAADADPACVQGSKANQAAIYSTTRIGLAAAHEVFGETGAVVLEESERERWFAEVYRPTEEGFWWYTFAWWTLREGLPKEDAARIRASHPIPAGSLYWVVESGLLWGELAGSAIHELWQWDGTRAEFIEVDCVDTY